MREHCPPRPPGWCPDGNVIVTHVHQKVLHGGHMKAEGLTAGKVGTELAVRNSSPPKLAGRRIERGTTDDHIMDNRQKSLSPKGHGHPQTFTPTRQGEAREKQQIHKAKDLASVWSWVPIPSVPPQNKHDGEVDSGGHRCEQCTSECQHCSRAHQTNIESPKQSTHIATRQGTGVQEDSPRSSLGESWPWLRWAQDTPREPREMQIQPR